MTTRERWVVYPLLFLTLGISVRDKFLPPSRFGVMSLSAEEITAEKIRCRNLQTAEAESQLMTVAGPTGVAALRMGIIPGSGGRLEVFGENGKALVRVSAERAGRAGFVETLGENEFPLVTVTNVGVFARISDVPNVIPLTTPWPLSRKAPPAMPLPAKPSQEKKEGRP